MTDFALPEYQDLAPENIIIVNSDHLAAEAFGELMTLDAIGFDTESKPVFVKGQQSTGPHLIQLASRTNAFLFQIEQFDARGVLKTILESNHIKKVGFNINGDSSKIFEKLGIRLHGLFDLYNRLPRDEVGNKFGLKRAVAKYLGKDIKKSKSMSKSDWSKAALTKSQLQYAGEDAFAALAVYEKTQA